MRVIVESPYAGNVEQNIAYARRCIGDCLKRGEAPFASHLLYTQDGILDDTVPEQRNLGMQAGWYWTAVADKVVVYIDLGTSEGMKKGIEVAKELGKEIEYRSLTGLKVHEGRAY